MGPFFEEVFYVFVHVRHFSMKLHMGCGSVYLEGWKNIDVRGPKTFLAADRPDLVEKWQTTEDKYYAKHPDKTLDTMRKGPLDQDYVCDTYGSFDNIPAEYWSVDEILSRQAFEHLSISEAHKALDQIDGILKPNGILRLDVPDHEATLKKFKETGDEFYIRHLLGPRRNAHGFHMMSYTRDSLRELVEEHGFVFDSVEPTIHFYPSICLKFTKPGPRAPRDYVKLPEMFNYWKVAEVGPGQYPFQKAQTYIDYDIEKLKPLSDQGKSTILGDIQSGLAQIPDKAYDFCLISHVLEHVDNVQASVNTLNRIAKSGMAIMPSAIKEGLFGGHEEADHKWLILPSPCECGPPVFVRHNPDYMRKIKDANIEKITSRLWRTGPNRHDEQRVLRKWFYENEQHLDVIVNWTTAKPLKVIVVE